MTEEKPLFKTPYDIKDVSALFAIVAFVLIIAAIVGNNLFGTSKFDGTAMRLIRTLTNWLQWFVTPNACFLFNFHY